MAACEELAELRLPEHAPRGAAEVPPLGRLVNLRMIDFGGFVPAPAVLAGLQALPRLRVVGFGAADGFSSDNWADIARTPALEVVYVADREGGRHTAELLSPLAESTTLKTLYAGVDPADRATLPGLRKVLPGVSVRRGSVSRGTSMLVVLAPVLGFVSVFWRPAAAWFTLPAGTVLPRHRLVAAIATALLVGLAIMMMAMLIGRGPYRALPALAVAVWIPLLGARSLSWPVTPGGLRSWVESMLPLGFLAAVYFALVKRTNGRYDIQTFMLGDRPEWCLVALLIATVGYARIGWRLATLGRTRAAFGLPPLLTAEDLRLRPGGSGRGFPRARWVGVTARRLGWRTAAQPSTDERPPVPGAWWPPPTGELRRGPRSVAWFLLVAPYLSLVLYDYQRTGRWLGRDALFHSMEFLIPLAMLGGIAPAVMIVLRDMGFAGLILTRPISRRDLNGEMRRQVGAVFGSLIPVALGGGFLAALLSDETVASRLGLGVLVTALCLAMVAVSAAGVLLLTTCRSALGFVGKWLGALGFIVTLLILPVTISRATVFGITVVFVVVAAGLGVAAWWRLPRVEWGRV